MNNLEKLEKLREKVNIVDYELVFLLAKRFRITKEILLLKNNIGLSIVDQDRENMILKEVGKIAKKFKIDLKFIEHIFRSILKESKNRKS